MCSANTRSPRAEVSVSVLAIKSRGSKVTVEDADNKSSFFAVLSGLKSLLLSCKIPQRGSHPGGVSLQNGGKEWKSHSSLLYHFDNAMIWLMSLVLHNTRELFATCQRRKQLSALFQ